MDKEKQARIDDFAKAIVTGLLANTEKRLDHKHPMTKVIVSLKIKQAYELAKIMEDVRENLNKEN